MKTKYVSNGVFSWVFLAFLFNFSYLIRTIIFPESWGQTGLSVFWVGLFVCFLLSFFSLQIQENMPGSLRIDQSDPQIVISVLFSGFLTPSTDINSFVFCGSSACSNNAAMQLRRSCQDCKLCIRDVLAVLQLESRGLFLSPHLCLPARQQSVTWVPLAIWIRKHSKPTWMIPWPGK